MISDDSPVLVLGAGINGAALARELVLNRVPTCVVDTADVAAGTTAYSSRLIHGGLRYLEYGEFNLVRESLHERERLLRTAPHLVRPLRLYIPVQSRSGGLLRAALRCLGHETRRAKQTARGLWTVRAGLWLYDVYAQTSSLPKHKTQRINAAGVPPMNASKYRWVCSYCDAQVRFPERLTVELLKDARRSAEEHGVPFHVYTYHEARLMNRVVEIRPRPPDALSTAESSRADVVRQFKPSTIINATGAWVDRTLQRLRINSPRLIKATRGSHLITFHPLLRDRLGGNGVYVEAADGRPVFVLPLDAATLIGTTDLPFDGDPSTVVATEREVHYLLDTVNDVFPGVALQSADIDFSYAGVRPLPFLDTSTPASITRAHKLHEHVDTDVPTYSVVGGKLTTCRSLAEEVTRKVMDRLGKSVTASSRDRVFAGGKDYPTDDRSLVLRQLELARRAQLDPEQVRAIWALSGAETEDVVAQMMVDRGSRDNLPGTCLPVSYVRHVIRHEWVGCVSDLVERRLMLIYQRNLKKSCVRRLVELLVEESRLPPQSVDREVEAVTERLRAHFGKSVDA